jgi:ATP-binding cassette subfamily B protein
MSSYHLIKPYFIKHRWSIIAGTLCLMMVDTLQLLIPRVIKWAVDDLTALTIDISGLAVYAGQIFGIALAMAVLRFFWRRFLIGTSRIIEEGLRNELFGHVQTLSARYFSQSKTGDLMAHATNDINNIRMAVGMGVVAFIDALFLGTMAVCFMAYINVKLTLFALIPMPAIVLFTRSFGKKMHRRYTSVQASFSDMTEAVRESFAGIRIVKAFNRERRESRRLSDASAHYVRQNLKLVRITGSFFPIMVLCTNISIAIVLVFGGKLTIVSDITSGDFVAFINYLNLLAWPMMAMGWVTNLIQRGAASLDRINAILQTRPEIVDRSDAISSSSIEGSISFENVSFAYGAGQPWVLQDISFTVQPGSVLGIVGPQGSGKTSLLQLIPRLYDVSKGRITIDSVDIRNFRLGCLRDQIGFVSQEPFLFAGTIRDNVTFGVAVDDSKLKQAAEAASLYETIESFPEGFHTIVGEKGVVLSGGQKQRVILARALIHNAPILLLDDPIGQVDTRTANAIIDTIRTLAREKTVIIVSHRLAAVQFADRIIVLDQGKISESGTHDQLMAQNNYYAKMFQMQRFENGR